MDSNSLWSTDNIFYKQADVISISVILLKKTSGFICGQEVGEAYTKKPKVLIRIVIIMKGKRQI